mmetsp:Transcript_2657/g.3691  ORF Transcript_2657/g.3691 Transcript_2657/m.3691 type:complete len:144 (+) Transcript_2657:103-534(+)
MGDFNQDIKEDELYPVPAEFQKGAHCSSMEQYQEMWKSSIEDPAKFYGAMAEELYWQTKFTEVGPKYNFDRTKGPVSIEWFSGGKTNVCYNSVDRTVEKGYGDKIAVYHEAFFLGYITCFVSDGLELNWLGSSHHAISCHHHS